MPEEYLDIVDENGNLTGEKELRSVVHEKGLWHWVAVVYFYRLNKNNLEFLVHLRSKSKQQHPNKWTLHFGGHVESGDTIEETVLKEIQEEVGIFIDSNNLIRGIKIFYDGIKENEGLSNREIGQTYYYKFKDDIMKLSFNDGEVQEAK